MMKANSDTHLTDKNLDRLSDFLNQELDNPTLPLLRTRAINYRWKDWPSLKRLPYSPQTFILPPYTTWTMKRRTRLDREFVSKTSIVINAPVAHVWNSLVNPDMAKQYFWGADVSSDWKVGSLITFRGEFNGNQYEEKGEILQFQPENLLQYSHWSDLEDLPDMPENYRNWTFRLAKEGTTVNLTVTEDNIPTEKQKKRSDEFWAGVLKTIKQLLEKKKQNSGT